MGKPQRPSSKSLIKSYQRKELNVEHEITPSNTRFLLSLTTGADVMCAFKGNSNNT